MATLGPFYPTSITSVAPGGGEPPWVNPSNAGSSDNSYATTLSTGTGFYGAEYLRSSWGTQFSAIPAGSTIDGMQLSIEGHNVLGAGPNLLFRLYDSSDSTPDEGGTTFTITMALPATTDSTQTKGDSTHGIAGGATPWTQGDIANLRLDMTCNKTDLDTFSIDGIQLQIWYTAPVVANVGLDDSADCAAMIAEF